MATDQHPSVVLKTIARGYRTELAPTDRQRQLFLRSCGVARFAFNWGLQRQQESMETTGRHLPYPFSTRSW